MKTSTTGSQSTPPAERLVEGENWQPGRLIVHLGGDDAGLLRLDMNLPAYRTHSEVEEHVKLVLPSELTPLSTIDVMGEDGRFICSFFSSDIANGGQLPENAVVCWDVDGEELHREQVSVIPAGTVREEEGQTADQVPGHQPSVVYPLNVAFAIVIAVVFCAICAAIVLLMAS